MCRGVLPCLGDDSLPPGRWLITIRIRYPSAIPSPTTLVGLAADAVLARRNFRSRPVILLGSMSRRSSGDENRADFTIDRERSAEALWRRREDRFVLDRGAGAAGT